jgi:hypothetical protein
LRACPAQEAVFLQADDVRGPFPPVGIQAMVGCHCYAPQRLEVASAAAAFVPEGISPPLVEGDGAEQEPALLPFSARSSRIRASNSARVG